MKEALARSVVVIPARLGSTRLPGKIMADIAGVPMILHVLRNAVKSGVSEVIVATDSEEVCEIVNSNGGKAIMTPIRLSSGTIRVGNALEQHGKHYDFVVNVQGDMPDISPDTIRLVIEGLNKCEKADIVTAVCKMDASNADVQKPNVVKAVLSEYGSGSLHKVLYFSRSVVPHGAHIFYSHIGIYGFRQDALQRFIRLPDSKLEAYERLEQLRALENNMSIYAYISAHQPISVDVHEDLEFARKVITKF